MLQEELDDRLRFSWKQKCNKYSTTLWGANIQKLAVCEVGQHTRSPSNQRMKLREIMIETSLKTPLSVNTS